MSKIRRWISYWIIDPFWGGVDLITFSFLRCLPLKQVSATGAFIGGIAKNRFKKATSDALANLRFLKPDLADEEILKISNTMWRNIGRTLTETAVLDKFSLARDVKENNLDVIKKLEHGRPVIFLFPHLGNWELLALSVINQGFKLNVMFEAVPNRFQRRLLTSSRKRIGYQLITPDYHGTRKLFRALASGETVGIAMDEFKNNRIMSPVFSGNVSKKSNITYAIELARRFNAPIVTGFCSRITGTSFEINYEQPICPDGSAHEIASCINDRCKDWILENIEQWYMLHRAGIKR